MKVGDVKPVPESVMLKRPRQYSICRVLREIYRSTDDPEIRLKARIATAMAKKMTAKLRQNKLERKKCR